MQILLIIVALGLIAAFVYLKVQQREPTEAAPPRSRAATTVVEPDEVEEVEEEYETILDDAPEASSSWLEDIAVRDDDALTELSELVETDIDVEEVETEPVAEVVVEEAEEFEVEEIEVDEPAAYEDLDETTVDEEFESLTADLDVDLEEPEEIVIDEEVETADDIMAASKATEINPAGNTELQRLLQKVQARLADYD